MENKLKIKKNKLNPACTVDLIFSPFFTLVLNTAKSFISVRFFFFFFFFFFIIQLGRSR